MKALMRNNSPVTVIFAEDDEFISYFTEDFLPNIKEDWVTIPEESKRMNAKTSHSQFVSCKSRNLPSI